MDPGFLDPIFSQKTKKKKQEKTEDTIMPINSNGQSRAANRRIRISFFSVRVWRSLNNTSFPYFFGCSK